MRDFAAVAGSAVLEGDAISPHVEVVTGALESGVLFLCDHASNALPPEYGDLGLAKAQLERHIAYDIGAAQVVRHLARSFSAPALLTRFSRLLIDPNRGPDDPTLVMRLSDGAIIPGNARIDAAEIERRRMRYWQPYRDAVTRFIDRMIATGVAPALVGVHSFTPFWKEVPRPWDAGVLWDKDPRMAAPFIAALKAEGDLVVGDNEPYDGVLEGDTMDTHATARGLASLCLEIRHDLVTREEDAAAWAQRIARLLRPVLARREVHIIEHHGSRAGSRARHPVTEGR